MARRLRHTGFAGLRLGRTGFAGLKTAAPKKPAPPNRSASADRGLGSDLGALEVLVRRTVVALRQRGALARLALARRRPAAGHTAVERTGLDLALDERDRGRDALAHRPGDLRLACDREVAA